MALFNVLLLIHASLSRAASTKEVILGTDNGQLFELAVDEKEKKEKYVKFLFELAELPEAFMDLQVHHVHLCLPFHIVVFNLFSFFLLDLLI